MTMRQEGEVGGGGALGRRPSATPRKITRHRGFNALLAQTETMLVEAIDMTLSSHAFKLYCFIDITLMVFICRVKMPFVRS